MVESKSWSWFSVACKELPLFVLQHPKHLIHVDAEHRAWSLPYEAEREWEGEDQGFGREGQKPLLVETLPWRVDIATGRGLNTDLESPTGPPGGSPGGGIRVDGDIPKDTRSYPNILEHKRQEATKNQALKAKLSKFISPEF